MRQKWFLWCVLLSLAFLIIYRAHSMSITHDEASTWLNYRHLNVWSCVSNPTCWGTANNHWLNTLLMQWTATLFGDVPWALRLPNVIAGIAYLLCALFFCTRYIQNNALRFAGFVLLCAHVYLLDFFSLARGYGMMASGVMWALYGMLRYIEKYAWSWLALTAISLSLAILSNFTALIPWMAFALSWFIWLITQKKLNIIIRHSWIWVINAGLLIPLLMFPLRMLSGSGEFGWGSKNPFMMLVDLVVNLLYGARWFGNSTALFFLLFLLLWFFLIVWLGLRRISMPNRSQILFMAILFITTISVVLFNQVLTGSMAPIGRKSIFLIPFLFGMPVLGLAAFENKKSGIVLSVFVSLLVLWRIPMTAHSYNCREWYTDANYPELFSVILPKGPDSDSVYISSSWIFNPSLTFYQKTIPLPLGGLPYQRPLQIDTSMQYYYVEPGDTSGMNTKGFVLDKKIGFFLLMKNRDFVRQHHD